MHAIAGFAVGVVVTVFGLAVLFRSRFRYGTFAAFIEGLLNLHI